MRSCFGCVIDVVNVVIPVAAPLNTWLALATPGNEPRASVAFHTPTTGIALTIVANPCSSSAVTSSVSERPALTESEDQAVRPYQQICPCHQPDPATAVR